MSILLIGIEGQLGSELAQRLPRLGAIYKTYFGRPVAGTANAIELDLTNHEKLEAVLQSTRPDLVVNAAAECRGAGGNGALGCQERLKPHAFFHRLHFRWPL